MPLPARMRTPSAAHVPPMIQSTPIWRPVSSETSSDSREVETTSSMTSSPSAWAFSATTARSSGVAPMSLKPM